MARRERGVPDGSAKAAELKEKLRGLAKAIVEDDDYSTRDADDAIATLCALRDLKCRRRSSFSDKLEEFPVPPEFRCPISTELMRDPVILATGQVPTLSVFFFPFCLTNIIIPLIAITRAPFVLLL